MALPRETIAVLRWEAAVHEAGHLLAAAKLGGRVGEVQIAPVNGEVLWEGRTDSDLPDGATVDERCEAAWAGYAAEFVVFHHDTIDVLRSESDWQHAIAEAVVGLRGLDRALLEDWEERSRLGDPQAAGAEAMKVVGRAFDSVVGDMFADVEIVKMIATKIVESPNHTLTPEAASRVASDAVGWTVRRVDPPTDS